jgi:hypothetical protein
VKRVRIGEIVRYIPSIRIGVILECSHWRSGKPDLFFIPR